MPMLKKLAALATAAAAARGYAKKNPDQAAKFVDQAAAFVDKQTKGKYSGQISGVAQKAKQAAGIPATPGGYPATNGYSATSGYGATAPAPVQPGVVPPEATPGTPTPGTPAH